MKKGPAVDPPALRFALAEAVKKTGRKRLVMAGILTEVCLAYPVVNALKDGYEVSFIPDASETGGVLVVKMFGLAVKCNGQKQF